MSDIKSNELYHTRTVRNITSEQITTVSNCSSKVRRMRSEAKKLHIRCAPELLIKLHPETPLAEDEADCELYRQIAKGAVLMSADSVRACARMTAEVRKQYETYFKRMDEVLAKPFSRSDYLKAFNVCAMSMEEFQEAERMACEDIFYTSSYFTMTVIIHFTSGLQTIHIPEASALRLLNEDDPGGLTNAI